MYKRILSLMLAVLLLVSLIPPDLISANTAEQQSRNISISPNSKDNLNLTSNLNTLVKNVTNLSANKETNNVVSFNDVKSTDWFYEAVNYVQQNGLFNGTGNDQFSPQGTMTRAMFVTVLGRIAGVEVSQYSSTTFADVQAGSWYAPYVQWAVENGITSGTGTNKFSPNDTLTREQMATFTVRFFDKFNIPYPANPNISTLPNDFDKVAPWAADAIKKLWQAGLINGTADGNFNPTVNATRAEAASFLMRSNEVVKKEREAQATPTTTPTSEPAITPEPTLEPIPPYIPPITSPTTSPTSAPTASPTSAPTASPTSAPTASPTSAPTASPTSAPTTSPIVTPTTSPNGSFTITFHTNGGEPVSSKTVAKGESLGELPSAYKKEHRFLGWYTNSELTDEVSLEAEVTSNLTLYAGYEKLPDRTLVTQSIPTITIIDQPSTFSIKVVDTSAELSAEEVKAFITFSSSSHTEFAEQTGIAVTGSNGEFTIRANNPEHAYPEGSTLQFNLNNDALIYKEGTTLHDATTRELVVTIAKAEVDNLQFKSDIVYISADDVAVMSQDGVESQFIANSLYQIQSDSQKNATTPINYDNGYFIYEGDNIQVGDTVVIYQGIHPLQRNLHTEEDNLSYVKIRSINGNEYHYGAPKVEDIIFIPDVLPVNEATDLDGDATNKAITVNIADMDYSDSIYDEFDFDDDLVIEAGDYISFYRGEFNSDSAVLTNYALITGVTLSNDQYTITYEIVTEKELLQSLDYYKKTDIDSDELINPNEIPELEEQMRQEAIDSGFAQKAAGYLALMAIETDSFEELSGDIEFNEDEIQYLRTFGNETMMRVAGSKVEVELKNIKVNLGTTLQHFRGKSGTRAAIEIEAEVTIDVSDNAEIKIRLKGVFEQELSLNISTSGEIFWKKAWIIPYPGDYTINANIDIFTYTAIQFDANLGLFEKDEEPNWYDGRVVNIAHKIKDIMDKAETVSDREVDEISNSLPDLYANLLENESDWVDIIEENLFKASFRVVMGIIEITFKADFVVSAKVNISLGLIYTYENGQRYSYNIRLLAGSVSNSNATLVPEKYEFTFYAMGELGLRAGIRLELAVGAISTDLNSIGVQVEVGGYVKLWGYFYYKYSKTEGQDALSRAAGAVHLDLGLYLEIKLVAQAFKGAFKAVPYSTAFERSLMTIGSRYSVVDFAYDQDSVEEIHLKRLDQQYYLPDSFFEMVYMDLQTGYSYKKLFYHETDFDITFNNTNFRYDPFNKRIVLANYVITGVDSIMTITFRDSFGTFNSKPLSRSFKVHYDDLYAEYSYNFLSYEDPTKIPSQQRIIKRVFGVYNSDLPKQSNPTRLGYDFIGWFDDINSSVPIELPEKIPADTILVWAKWKPRTDTPYVVELYTQHPYTGEYTLHSSESYRGTTGETADYEPQYIEYYITPVQQEVKIKGDGTTVIKYYYERGKTTITFSYDYLHNLNIPFGISPNIEYLTPGTIINYPYFSIAGARIVGWDNADERAPLEPKTYYAIFELEERDYTVNYYGRNTMTSSYVKVFSEIKSGLAWDRIDPRKEEYKEEFDFFKDTEYVLNTDEYFLPAPFSPLFIDPDNSNLVMNLYYNKLYKATFNLNGGSLTDEAIASGGGKMVDGNYVIFKPDDYAFGRPSNPTRDQYRFVGWENWDLEEYPENRLMPLGGITFRAIWEPLATKYVVEHYVQNGNDGDSLSNYTLHSRTELNGSVGNTVTAAPIEIPNYNYASDSNLNILTGTVKADGTLVLRVIYDRAAFTAKFYAINPVTNDEEVIASSAYSHGSQVTIPLISDLRNRYEGYGVVGWEAMDGAEVITNPSTQILIMPAKDISYRLTLEPLFRNYVIEHYIQNATEGNTADPLSGYTLYRSVPLESRTGINVTATPLEIDDYYYASDSELNVVTGAVKGDGSLILRLIYDRDVYQVKFYAINPETDEEIVIESINSRHGAQVAIPTIDELKARFQGYNIIGWVASDGVEEIDLNTQYVTMPKRNVSYQLIVEPVKHVIEYYIQKTSFFDPTDPISEYELYDSITIEGNVGDMVTAAIIDIEHYKHNPNSSLNVLSGTISDDEALVLRVIYDRNLYTASFIVTDPYTAEEVDISSEIYRHGAWLTFPSSFEYRNYVPGEYRAVGWRLVGDQEEELIPIETQSIEMPANNVTYELILELSDGEDDGGYNPFPGGGGGFPGFPNW